MCRENVDVFGDNDDCFLTLFLLGVLSPTAKIFLLLLEDFSCCENFLQLWEFSQLGEFSPATTIFLLLQDFSPIVRIFSCCGNYSPHCDKFSLLDYTNSLMVNYLKHTLVDHKDNA